MRINSTQQNSSECNTHQLSRMTLRRSDATSVHLLHISVNQPGSELDCWGRVSGKMNADVLRYRQEAKLSLG